MIQVDVNNYRRDNDKNKTMHYSSSDTDTSSTSSLISSSASVFVFDECHSKIHVPPMNQVETGSDLANFKRSSLENNKSGIFLNTLEKNKNVLKSITDSEHINMIGNTTLNNSVTACDVHTNGSLSDPLLSDTSLQQQHISESIFESNLESLSHYDNFGTDLQERKVNDDDFIFCDMTSANDLNFIAHYHKDSKGAESDNDSTKIDDSFTSDKSGPNDDETTSEDTNFSFAEEVENFEKMGMQSPQMSKNKKRVDDLRFGPKEEEEDGERVKKINKKGHNVYFADKLVTVYSCVLDPWKEVSKCSNADLLASYIGTCEKNATHPSPGILAQLQEMTDPTKKVESFSLKDLMLSTAGVDALEEVFRRIRIGCLNVQAAVMDEQASVMMFDLLSYYEPCDRLVISASKDIGMRGWQALSQYLKQTTSLYSLEGRDLIVPENSFSAFLRGIQFCCNLQSLSLHNSISSGRHLSLLVNAIRGSDSITRVSLRDNQLNCHDALSICTLVKDHTRLQCLDVSNNLLMDQGATHIFDLLSTDHPSLLHISLANNRLSKFSLPVLSRSLKRTETLQSLVLDHNDLFNEGVGRLKDGLACNHSLTHLSLQGVGVSCEGIASLSEFITSHPKLQHLNLLGNQLGEDALTSISRSLRTNQTLMCVDLDKTKLVNAVECSSSDDDVGLKGEDAGDKEGRCGESDGEKRGEDMNERRSRLFEEIDGYVQRNRQMNGQVLEETPADRPLDSDTEVHSSCDSLPAYNNLSKAYSSNKNTNNLPFLLSLSLTSLSLSSSPSLSPTSSSSSLSAALSASLSSLSTLSSTHTNLTNLPTTTINPPPTTTTNPAIKASNDLNTDSNQGTTITNKSNNATTNESILENGGAPDDDGLPTYQEAVQHMNSMSPSSIPLITVNGLHHSTHAGASKPTASVVSEASTTATPATLASASPKQILQETTTASQAAVHASNSSTPPPSSTPNTSPKPPCTRSPLSSLTETEVRMVSSPTSKKKFRVSRTLGSTSPITLSPTLPPSILSSASLLASPSSLSSSSSSL